MEREAEGAGAIWQKRVEMAAVQLNPSQLVHRPSLLYPKYVALDQYSAPDL
jgi:hypothetical protein